MNYLAVISNYDWWRMTDQGKGELTGHFNLKFVDHIATDPGGNIVGVLTPVDTPRVIWIWIAAVIITYYKGHRTYSGQHSHHNWRPFFHCYFNLKGFNEGLKGTGKYFLPKDAELCKMMLLCNCPTFYATIFTRLVHSAVNHFLLRLYKFYFTLMSLVTILDYLNEYEIETRGGRRTDRRA